ncbi:hypothetical protein EHQ12_18330 [Leptospira gomenensis]|uniref:Uncharacterized protein n=1 Tax=Leptospira gomenensis TaxID=2484974 RepID=A0A5F1YQG7_9LEPT|nr:hypothetical protein [Leptospira gomenensis]TGK32570.1 hypothetical protein EHQ12_18330 [Leptospira gomenensis]TGK38300.1 hypothetical protein EHQ17_01205 [Leptospira gomenensis]TGK52114.1 hypothetical protein EHQ07_00630 [Leptospira gomenensis]TGK59837.1 hypothetical protein EHQ13_11425 [Leptospira gomenensis]
MQIVYNGTAGILGLVAVGVSILLSFLNVPWNPWGMLTFCSILAIAGGILEITLGQKFRPRYFYLIPAWLTGICGIGLIVWERNEWAGYAIFAGTSIPFYLWIRDEVKRPGGKWVYGLLGGLSSILLIQIWMQGKPSIASHVLNVGAISLFSFSLFKTWWERKKAVGIESV